MARDFTVKIRMAGAAMLIPRDVAGALHALADKLEDTEVGPRKTVGLVWDDNGNSVGTWTISREGS